jgi:hypothetical protein
MLKVPPVLNKDHKSFLSLGQTNISNLRQIQECRLLIMSQNNGPKLEEIETAKLRRPLSTATAI